MLTGKRMSRPWLATELYLACPRCAWHARRVQRERPTQRGILTGHMREGGSSESTDVAAWWHCGDHGRPHTGHGCRRQRGECSCTSRVLQVAPGDYGEGDIFLGLKLGELRLLAKPYVNLAFEPDQWLPMLRSPIHEHRLITLVVMSERAKKIAKRRGEDEFRLIYDTYLGNTSYVNNWDLVDISCGPIVGGYLLDRDRSPLYELVRSDLLWERRIAMVGSQRFLRRGETSDLYRLAVILLPDRHDLIHKAVGWSLREAGKKVDADELRRFLDQYAATMPRTALRYAIEHFDAAERQHYLTLPRTPAASAPRGRTSQSR
jgi:3-methyladenine DNA glycosylase AlkD